RFVHHSASADGHAVLRRGGERKGDDLSASTEGRVVIAFGVATCADRGVVCVCGLPTGLGFFTHGGVAQPGGERVIAHRDVRVVHVSPICEWTLSGASCGLHTDRDPIHVLHRCQVANQDALVDVGHPCVLTAGEAVTRRIHVGC